MATVPAALLDALEKIKGFNRVSFESVHDSGLQVTSIRLNSSKTPAAETQNLSSSVPWCANGYYLNDRPSFTLDPCFHGGAYYVQEASSMFLEQAVLQTLNLESPLRVLDLCAAPGGKSTHLQSLISRESLLVCNEVIKSRAAILYENITKWGGPNVVITGSDPQAFGAVENYFDLLVVDAPCSGSGLFRREPEAITHWSEQNVELCSQRQQRILSDAWPALKEEGILIYSTCSYSWEEDEAILNWIENNFNIEGISLRLDPNWNIVETSSSSGKLPGYRFFPDRIHGEGFFLACMRKKEGGTFKKNTLKKSGTSTCSRADMAVIQKWLTPINDLQMFYSGDSISAIPSSLYPVWQQLQGIYIKNTGMELGKINHGDFIPSHAFALSDLRSGDLLSVNLGLQDALSYLRREPISLPGNLGGWVLIKYENIALGWVKALPNRVNNYYPVNWRILK